MPSRLASAFSRISELPTRVLGSSDPDPEDEGDSLDLFQVGSGEHRPRSEPEVPTAGPYPHVEPHAGGWAVRREGESVPERTFSTREPALSFAYDIAADGGWPVVVHRTDGSIEEIIALI